MAYTLIVVGLCIIFAIVVAITSYYGDRKTSPWYVRLSVVIGWFFPFSIILVLPLDITSSFYRNLTEEEKLHIKPPIGYQSEEFFNIFWNITYWISYVLTWLILPLLSGYILSGHFTPLKKFKDSINQNVIFYGVLGGIGAIFIVYIAIAKKMTGKALLAFLMAMSNAWGLLLCIIFLGYGLVDIPRQFWRKADLTWIQNYYQFKAPSLKDDTLNAKEDLQKVVKDIFYISNSNSITTQNPLRPYLEQLIELCPITNDDANNYHDEDDDDDDNYGGTISLNQLANLNYKLKNAILANTRCEEQYKELINEALQVENILHFKDDPNREVRLPIDGSHSDSWLSKLKYKLTWLWYFKIRSYILLTISCLLILLSISVIWSEVTFEISNSNMSLFYIYLKYSNYVSYIFFEGVIVILLLYMCICTYTSLFKLQLFQYYRLFPNHHTDDNSLVFCAAYLCRLIFPLCYNFLNLTDNSQTAFSKIMGKIDLVPLLGKEFNGYVPIMMAVFTVITFFNLHGKFLKIIGFDSYFGIDHFSMNNEEDQDNIQDGRILIDQARREQQRNYNSNFNSKYNSTNYSNFDIRTALNSSSHNKSSNSGYNNNYNNYRNSNYNYYHSNSNNNNNNNNNFNSSDSINYQGSAFDYPFHYKNHNQTNAYAAPSSTEYNQNYGSYTSSNGSTFYTPSVGGQSTPNTFTHFTNGGRSGSSHPNSHDNPSTSSHSKFFSHLFLSGFHSKSLNSKSTSRSTSKSKSQSTQNPKKRFGFNITTDPEAFYSNYPPLLSHHQNPNQNPHQNPHQNPNLHQASSSTLNSSYTTTNPVGTHYNSINSSSHGHSIISSPTTTATTTSSTRKFGHSSSIGNFGGGYLNSPTTTIKSKKRMFGVNYKLNS